MQKRIHAGGRDVRILSQILFGIEQAAVFLIFGEAGKGRAGNAGRPLSRATGGSTLHANRHGFPLLARFHDAQ
jgi:hypothetical protein